MRKISKKTLATATSLALVATLMAGVGAVDNTVKAAETEKTLSPWVVYHSPKQHPEWTNGNAGIVNSFITTAGESAALNANATEQSVSMTKPADGFTMDIANTGWDCNWLGDTINPWSVRAEMPNISVIPGHDYTITFTASATVQKYAYIGTIITAGEGDNLLEGNENAGAGFLVIGTTPKEYTINFTNWVSAKQFTLVLNLGAFDSFNDYDGTSLVSAGLTAKENGYKGIVTVSNFKMVDKDLNPDFPVTVQPATSKTPATTQKPTTVKPPVKPTTVKAPTQVKGVKVVNQKGKKAKVTWKKVSTAKSYKVTYATNKKFKSAKNSTVKTVSKVFKNLKKNKTYYFKVRAVGKTGKLGKWSSVKSVKIKK